MGKYAIIADTACETTPEIIEKYGITYASFKIDVDEQTFVDDENLDLDGYIETMNKSPNPIKTACPSPGDFKAALEANIDAEEFFIITISKKLSGTYDSAILAKNMFLEEHPEKKVYVIDSKSAVSGETIIYMGLTKLLDQNLPFEEIVEKIEAYVENCKTLFVLEDLSNLIKNGRMNKPAGFIANMLSIKPVMTAVDGEIELHELSRGINSSLTKMVKAIETFAKETLGKTIVISHVRDLGKAEKIKEKVIEAYKFSEIKILQARGLSSGYAADKGIVISFEM